MGQIGTSPYIKGIRCRAIDDIQHPSLASTKTCTGTRVIRIASKAGCDGTGLWPQHSGMTGGPGIYSLQKSGIYTPSRKKWVCFYMFFSHFALRQGVCSSGWPSSPGNLDFLGAGIIGLDHHTAFYALNNLVLYARYLILYDLFMCFIWCFICTSAHQKRASDPMGLQL